MDFSYFWTIAGQGPSLANTGIVWNIYTKEECALEVYCTLHLHLEVVCFKFAKMGDPTSYLVASESQPDGPQRACAESRRWRISIHAGTRVSEF